MSSVEAFQEYVIPPNTFGAQHIVLQVWGWKIAGWEQEQDILSPVFQAPGLVLHEIAGDPNLLCLQADVAQGPPAPQRRGPRVAVLLSSSSRPGCRWTQRHMESGAQVVTSTGAAPSRGASHPPRGYSTSGGWVPLDDALFLETFPPDLSLIFVTENLGLLCGDRMFFPWWV